MTKFATRMVMTAAAVSMAFTPVVAQAGTRASEGTSISAPGQSRTAEGEKAKSGSTIILALLASGLIVTGIAFSASSKDKGQSPGR